jgi:hypothetical protein
MRYDSGFDASDTLTGTTLLFGPRYQHPDDHGNPTPSPDLIRIFIGNLLPRLQALPGVQSAAIASALPLGEVHDTAITFGPPTPPPPAATWETAPGISVTPDYFRVVGNTIVQGRSFSSNDTAASPAVAIVNRALAIHYFAGNALGKRFNWIVGPDQFAPLTIVGIVNDVRHNGLEQQVQPEFYIPESQSPSDTLNIALRSTTDPALLANAMRKAVLAVDPQQPLFDIQTMDQRVSSQVAQRRLIMLLIAASPCSRSSSPPSASTASLPTPSRSARRRWASASPSVHRAADLSASSSRKPPASSLSAASSASPAPSSSAGSSPACWSASGRTTPSPSPSPGFS